MVRDAHGIAKGGVRLPQVEAPVAMNCAIPLEPTRGLLLRGSSRMFDAAELGTLYGNEAAYLKRFEQAAQRCVQAGAILARDVAPLMEEAAQEFRRAMAGSQAPSGRARAASGPA